MSTHEPSAAAPAPSDSAKPAVAAAGLTPASRPSDPPRRRGWLRPLAIAAGAVVALVLVWRGIPVVHRALVTVSTDDAYVNSHVTVVAPRVAGQVQTVLVDDNNRVRKGDLLVTLDKEPYQIEVNAQRAALETAEADVTAAHERVRGLVAQTRGNRFKLERAIQDVDNQVAKLRAAVAAYQSQQATFDLGKADRDRAERLLPTGAISKAEYDEKLRQFRVGEAQLQQALEDVYQVRVALGLPAMTEQESQMGDVPKDLDQTFSTVRAALADLLESAAPLGITTKSFDAKPREVIAEFYQRDPSGDVDRIFAEIIRNATPIRQAESRRLSAQRALEKAELDLRYCDIVSEIDGVVTRRNVNPGNHVQVGQALMAVRSLTEIWIDANFKETQLSELRIGQRVELEVDMYGSVKAYEGRITGFTMGTGSTLALLPAQNATGNFVKVVQRLPVRIELTDYRPDEQTLFVGLSVVPYVYYREPASGPDAGKMLQPPTTKSSPAAPPEGRSP